MSENHALVFGASGITGWAITNQILNGYPSEDAFKKVTALTNRSLSPEASLWPKSEKLQLVSGLDLMNEGGQEALDAEMKKKVKGIDTVTHVFFFAYIQDPDPKKECQINVELLERAVKAAENCSKKLHFVVLPTGTKAYGVHLLKEFPFTNDLPLKESLPRIPEPYASQMFYYNQIDFLTELAKGKSWTWCEVIPDNIIGFVPNNNVYCMAQTLGLYLALYRSINGAGAEVVFPGNTTSWKILSNECSQDILAKFCIWASLNSKKTGNGQRWNVADAANPSSWSKKWPGLCEFFELKGVAPSEGESGPQPAAYVQEHLAEWNKLEKENGLVTGRVRDDPNAGGFAYFIMTLFDFDRNQDLSKTHGAWGSETVETDIPGSWWTAFQRFRDAKIIP